MHEVLVNRLGGLSLPRKSVVRLTDRPDMTLDVYRGRKTTKQQNNKIVENQFLKSCFELSLAIFITGCPEILQKHLRPIYQKRIGIIITDSHFSIFVCNS